MKQQILMMKLAQLKHKPQSKEIVQTLAERQSNLLTTIKSDFLYYILAVVCSTAFFIHEFVPVNSPEYLDIVQKHSEAKSFRSKARKNVLDSQKGTDLYRQFEAAEKETDVLWSQVIENQSKERFLAFKSFQQFLGEFGWALGLFIYSLFNIVMVYIKNQKTKVGEIILHSTLLFVSIYFINWATMPRDYEKTTYLAFAIAMTILIIISVSLLLKAKKRHINSLILNIKDLVGFVFKHTKKEYEDEMWNVLKNVRHDR